MAEISIDTLLRWRAAHAEVAAAQGAKMFMGKPESWFDDTYWFCPNGHVSGTILRCEEDGDVCLACYERVVMGPPIGERAFAPILARLKAIEVSSQKSDPELLP